jgi:uncharacterized repeat protein (TIGR01451 family)
MQEKANTFASPRATLGAALMGVGFFLIAANPFIAYAQTAPTVDIKANGSDSPITIQSGGSVTVTWNVSNATSCFASGSWGGNKPNSGSETFSNITSVRIYDLTCLNGGGPTAYDSVTVNVQSQPQQAGILGRIVNRATGKYILDPSGPNGCDNVDARIGGFRVNYSGASSGSALPNACNNEPYYGFNGPAGTYNLSLSIPSGWHLVSVDPGTSVSVAAGETKHVWFYVERDAVANPTVDIKANGSDGPITVQSGTQATLSWNSSNATNCNASGGPWSGTKQLSGSESTQTLTQPATYSITCTNSAGQSASDSVTINIQQVQNPTVDIKANGQDGTLTLPFVQQFTLSWTSNNATSCQASNGWSGSKTLNGSEVRNANASFTTYTITCTNSAGVSASDSVSVMVQGDPEPPTVDLRANGSNGPITIQSGTQATLSWTSNNATSCQATGGPWSGTKQLNSSESTQPLTQSTTYTITCSNSVGVTASDSVTINVNQPQNPTVDIKANGSDGPVQIAYNTSATLSWTSNNATSCYASSGPWSGNKPLNSSESTGSLTQGATYTITCQNSQGVTDSDSVTITVSQPQNPTVDIKANGSDGPITIQSGTQATLSWTSQNANSCYASSGPWSGTKALNSSETTQSLTQNTTYSITCQNSQGVTDSDSVTINIQQQNNPTVDIKANGSDNPSSITYGATANLSWTSQNATTCYASSGPWSGTKSPNSSETSGSLTQTTTFGITCIGSNGQSVTDTVTVPVSGQPQNPTVDIKANGSDGPITIQSGTQATLSWTSQNANSCYASGGPWSGTKQLSGSESTPTITQSTTFAITCTNSQGQTVSDSVTINVNQQQNPPTVDLKANGSDGPVNVNYNSTANLSWTSQNATTCYASGGPWSGTKSTNNSEQTQNLTQSTTYSITCTNSAGQSASDSVTVNVNQQQNAPTVNLYASPNSVISGSQSRLYWTSQNAVSCQAAGGPWYGTKSLNDNEVTQPLYQTTTYTITCQNAQGQTATQSTTVTVQGVSNTVPTLNFYANPSQVPVGNTSTLYWNTTNADYCVASGDSQGGWSGNKAVNGSQVVGPIYATQNYILTCYGPGGSVVRNTTVSPIGQVLGAAAPTLTIYAIPSPVQYGNSSNIYWNATNVDRCNASGDWFGIKTTSGQEPTGPLFAARTYTLTCYGQGGTITRSAVVPVVGGPVYVPPVYTPPTCPPGGCVQGITGTYGASIDKLIENLSMPGSSGSQVTARPGNELRYTITVRNTGTLTLTNLTVRDVLSDKVEIRTASDGGTYDYTNRTVTWKIARLAAGESKTLTLTVRVIQCDTDVVIENRAYVKSAQINEVSSNNTVAGVSAGPFTVTIDNPAPIVAPGDKVTYTIRYRNDSGATVRGAVLEVYIPAGMIIEGYSQTCTVSGNTVRLNIGDVTPGQSGQVQVIGKIDSGVLDGEQLVTRAVVSYRDASSVARESSATTMSTVDRDGNTVTSGSNNDAEFAAAASEGTSRGLSFLPDTFFGWLLLLLLIIILAIFVKRLLAKE